MAQIYKIDINNHSGRDRKYAVLTANPQVVGRVEGEVWSTAMLTVSVPASGTAQLRIPSDWIAVQGTGNGSARPRTPFNISNTTRVSLSPGSYIAYSAQDRTPRLSDQGVPSNGLPGTFIIQTQSDFTLEDAHNGNWMIGVGKEIGEQQATSVFTPAPNTIYHIRPENVFWVAEGGFSQGNLIDIRRLGSRAVKVDFTAPGAQSSVYISEAEGKLVIQR